MSAQLTPEDYLRWVAQKGDLANKGMESLFRLFGPRIKAYFRQHRMSDEEASDLLQETFIKVYRSADKFNGQSKASTWLWVIAKNCMLDYLRSKKNTESLDEMLDAEIFDLEIVSGMTCPEDQMTIQDCIKRGFTAFGEQHPDRVDVMRLVVFEEWDMDDVAQFLSRTPAATREYISQCRKRLREFLLPCRDLLEA
jgi:RNA polymerase sigma-70 factor (ECF subfamily)